MPNDTPFPFDGWWTAVLYQDDKWLRHLRSDEAFEGKSPLLSCVFCSGPLDPETPGNAMLAWWERDNIVSASGLYHTGQHRGGRCLDLAEQAGGLLDIHAEKALGKSAMSEMRRIAWDYDRWEGRALQRLVRIFGELSEMKLTGSPRRARTQSPLV